MGFFDLPAPLFNLLDQALSGFLPPLLRVSLWAVLGGWISMLIYRLLSNQQRLGVIKAEIKQVQSEMNGFDGEASELWDLVRRNLSLSFKRIAMTLGPALLAGIPLIFLLAWCSNQFGSTFPEAGDSVVATLSADEPTLRSVRWSPSIAAQQGQRLDQWTLTWPEDDEPLLLNINRDPLVQLPTHQPSPVLHPKQWWNALVANPAGYLPDGTPLDSLHLELPQQQMLPIGPRWLRSWWFVFLTVLLGWSLFLKFRWAIS